MNTLYQTTAMRLSMKDNEVVINPYTGKPDVQIAGLIAKVGATVFQSDKLDPVTGLPSKPFYRGRATVWSNGANKDVDIIIPASQITAVSVGDTKWLTARPNGEYTGYSCGGLDVTNPDSVDVFEAMLAGLGYDATTAPQSTVKAEL